MTDLTDLDATAQAELVATGEATPADLVDAAVAALEKVNPELNAVIHERFEKARAEAAGDLPDGPFRGVPYVHKDHDGSIPGEPLHHGIKALKEAGYVSPDESNMARRFREAGLICLGKTNCPELGLVPTTEPEAYGPTHNPWDTERSPGGSSGGSAAAVAARAVAVGSAGDGGGSIRWPASSCGLVGLKTSRGRISLAPQGEVWGGLVVHGFVTRSVRDTASLLDATAGLETGDPYGAPAPARPYRDEVGADPGRLRVGVLTEAPGTTATTDPDCVAAAENTAKLLEELGHHVEVDHPAALTDEDITQDFINVFTVYVDQDLIEMGRLIGKERLEQDDVELGTWTLAETGRQVSATDYALAWESLRALSRRAAAWWNDFDVLLTPTGAEPPPTLGQFASPPDNPMQGLFRSAGIVPFLAPFNVTGQPAVSLPLDWNDEGLPIGSQLATAYGREDILIRLAAQLETARPWGDRKPPLSV